MSYVSNIQAMLKFLPSAL